MVTPEILLESIDSYRKGEKAFCRLATITNEKDGIQKYLGFWIEIVKNERKLVALIQFESLAKDKPIEKKGFSKRKRFEKFIEDARLSVSNDLEKMLGRVLKPVENIRTDAA